MARPRKRSDEEILEVARRVFIEHGPAASTVLVADAVGLSQAALFKRFGTKEHLLVRALLPVATPAWLELVDRGPDERPVPEQLHEIAEELIAFFDRMLPCLMTLKAAGLDLHALVRQAPDPPPLQTRRALRAWFQRAVDRGLVRGADPDALAFTFVGAMQARAAFSHMFGAEPLTPALRRAHARGVVDALWSGLAPRPAATES